MPPHEEDAPAEAPRVLLVDDDRAFRQVYGALLREAGYEITEAEDRPGARAAFAARAYHAVLLDLMLPPDGSAQRGLALLAELLGQRPGAKIIVVSGAGDAHFPLQAVRQGAYDFLTKPADPDVLEVVLQRAVTRARLERQVSRLRDELDQARPSRAMIGISPAFTRAVRLAERVAPSELPVLVTGEPGTGKELMARTVHERSRRADGPFLPVNCGALTESLLESTLFGHRQGAFTGAVRDRPGLFRAGRRRLALPRRDRRDAPPLGGKVLRAIEYGEYLPGGQDQPERVDVRVISATNLDLEQMQAGRPSARICTGASRAPRSSTPDARAPRGPRASGAHFLNKAASMTASTGITPTAEPRGPRSCCAPTPGQGTCASCATRCSAPRSWPARARSSPPRTPRWPVASRRPARPAGSAPRVGALQDKIEWLERREIRAALRRHEGNNRTRTAEASGVLSRQGLLNKIEPTASTCDALASHANHPSSPSSSSRRVASSISGREPRAQQVRRADPPTWARSTPPRGRSTPAWGARLLSTTHS